VGGVRRRQFLIAGAAALAAPLSRAQGAAKPVRLGILSQGFKRDTGGWDPFFAALRARGWREGTDYVVDVKEARGDPARALTLAKELVKARADLILALSTAAAMAAKQATTAIPIVTWCGYPVESGLAATMAQPGGNVTGTANYANAEVWGKFVELLRECKPSLRQLGVLWDYAPPAFPDGLIPLPAIEHAAQSLGIKTRVWMVRTQKDLGAALHAADREAVEAMVVSNSGGIHFQKESMGRISELIARRRLFAITDIANRLIEMNCVLAYSPNVPEMQERLAHFIDRILRGAKPAALPFEGPSRFDLAVNMKSARAIGLTVPQPILLRADRVLE
jgi:putative ABC transport system substrate-binding protein